MKFGTKLKTQSDFTSKLVSLVLPITFQQFMLALVSASDALMLGKLSQNALSAVALASQISFVQSLFLAALTIGLSILLAQYWGKKDTEAVSKIFCYGLKISAILSLLFSIVAFIFPAELMQIFTNEKDLIFDGAKYLKVVSFSYFLTGISQIFLCLFKNCERAFQSSLISSVGVVANIIFNAIFIFGLFSFPALGIAGAALATICAKIIELTWCILDFKFKSQINFQIKHLIRNDIIFVRDFWKYTFPVLGNEIVWGVGFTMYSVIMGHLGSDAVAANSITNIAKNLIACFCIGLGSGGGILVGIELGKGNLEHAKLCGEKLCHLAIFLGTISGILFIPLSFLITSFANLSETANEYLKWMLLMCSYYMLGKSINSTTIAGIFCAGGDSKFGFICDSITMWCVTVPLGFFAAFVLKLPVLAVFFIVNLDEIVKLPAVYQHYKKYRWVKNITR